MLPSLRQVAAGVQDVGDTGEGGRLEVTVADLPGDAQCALVAGGGFGQVAEMLLGVAQVAPDISLKLVVATFSVERECLPAERAGLLVVAEAKVKMADGEEHVGLSRLVANVLEQAQALLGAAGAAGEGPWFSFIMGGARLTIASPARLPSRRYSRRLVSR